MSHLLAIDPGYTESAWVLFDCGKPADWAKEPNGVVLERVRGVLEMPASILAIESVASYGMPVGVEVFRTCEWSGRFIERWLARGRAESTAHRVYRRDVKLHLCGSARAKDSHIRQAIIDRYGPGKAAAVGVKASPGVLYGMKADCWQALAVAITDSERSAVEQAA